MKKIETLIIAVGGKGGRIANHFNRIRFHGPKALFPIGHKPLISYLIDLALALKFKRVYLLTSHFEVNIRKYLGTYHHGSKNMIAVHGGSIGRRYGVPHLIYSLRKSLTKPFIYTDGNILFAPELLQKMRFGKSTNNIVTLAVSKKDHAHTHAQITVVKGKIRAIRIRLPQRGFIKRLGRNNYCSMGVMEMHPKIFSACQNFAYKLDLDNVIEQLHDTNPELVKPIIYSKAWFALHQKQDLDKMAKSRYSQAFRSLTSVSTLTDRRLRRGHHRRILPIDRRK